jgi:hypothetical protein
VNGGSRKVCSIAVASAIAAAFAAAGSSAASAGATNCPYITSSKLAAALGLRNATAYLAKGPEHLEDTAYQFSLCRAVAWSGATPSSPSQAQAKVNSGQGAAVVIKTNEELGGTQEEIEKWHKEYEQQTEAFHASGFALVNAHHGNSSIFIPAAFGAPSEFGFEAVVKGTREVSAIWYSDSQHDYITIGITGSKQRSTRKSLEKIAKTAVPGFGA